MRETVRPAATVVVRMAHAIRRPHVFIMAAVLISLGFYLIYPVFLLLVYSFNVAPEVFVGTPEWGFENWRVAFVKPGLLLAIFNSFMIWAFTFGIAMPIAVIISWTLARTRIPWSNQIEFMFWIAYMIPALATTIGWITLLDPDVGLINEWAQGLPLINGPIFNIFSPAGIVFAGLMGNGITLKVMLLTPAFRNMDAALEEAARVGGASNLRTMLRVTLPLMISPMILVTALQLLRIFQGFETELLLGTPIGFFVYSTFIFDLVDQVQPQYGQATVLASLTMGIIAFIIPLQRWILQRRRYTTISSGFRPGLIDIGRWKYAALGALFTLLSVLTWLPMAALLLGSFMVRAGYFGLDHDYTMGHWNFVLTDTVFLAAVKTTIILGVMAAFFSPLLFSLLAYILVRTKWSGRLALDWIIWGSGAIPGMLSGLGLLVLFLGTPGLSFLFGTIWALLLVVIISGNTSGVNIMKSTLIQVGQEMEEAARIAGAGWLRTYVFIWIPLMMRTLVLLAVLNFAHAAGATSSIILLASRDTLTLSILALEYRLSGANQEAASIVAIILMLITVVLAWSIRAFGLRMGVRHS